MSPRGEAEANDAYLELHITAALGAALQRAAAPSPALFGAAPHPMRTLIDVVVHPTAVRAFTADRLRARADQMEQQ